MEMDSLKLATKCSVPRDINQEEAFSVWRSIQSLTPHACLSQGTQYLSDLGPLCHAPFHMVCVQWCLAMWARAVHSLCMHDPSCQMHLSAFPMERMCLSSLRHKKNKCQQGRLTSGCFIFVCESLSAARKINTDF